MANRIIPPIRLQPDTGWPDALAQIDLNFKNILSTLGGFSVEDVIGFPDNLSSAIIAPTDMAISPWAALIGSDNDDVVFMVPKISMYVDVPSLSPGETAFNSDYLFPTGAALTSDQKACSISVITGMTNATINSFTAQDGTVFYYANRINVCVVNHGSVDHLYTLVQSTATYTKGNSFYR